MTYKIIKALLIFLPLMGQVFAEEQVKVSEIEKKLTCLCDCSMTVETCQGAMNCQTSDRIRTAIITLVNEGRSQEEILTYFVNQYGEIILAIPSKKGFNLMAWILPFLAIFVAGWLIYLGLTRWVKHKARRIEKVVKTHSGAFDPAYEEKLNRELDEFEG